MIVVFPYAFPGGQKEEDEDLARRFVAHTSSMPGVECVIQTSDEITPALDGVTEVIRTPWTGDFADWHLRSLADIPYQPFLRLDCDAVMLQRTARWLALASVQDHDGP